MKYIALTIGPIIETLSLGRKTAEIWAASYLFSSFMKGIIDDLRKKELEFIIPYVEDDDIFKDKDKDNSIGLFHDRFILTTKTVTLKEVDIIVQTHKDALAVMIASSIKQDEEKVKAYINQYLQTYLVELDDTFENPILEISDILDSVELHVPFVETDKDYMRLFLNRDIVLNSSMAKKAFGSNPSFPSIPEIAARDIELKLKKDDDDSNAYKQVENEKYFKQTYKYIAIVHADGDNLGSYIKGQDDPAVVSKRLFDFDTKAVIQIEDYGGVPIFVGGDDLLFFAPVLNKEETIFDLIDKLSTLYRDEMKSDDTTLSFGVSITYYKYPLYEALEQSRNALFDKAKKYPDVDNPTKNAIHISARKHSGQSFEVTVCKADDSYTAFRDLLKDVLVNALELPHSIHHKLEGYEPLFLKIPHERIEATFNNLFNEEIHQNKFEKGLKDIRKLMIDLGVDKRNLERLFALLSITKLLRGDR